MKILVPIKRVIDPYAKVQARPDGSAVETTGVKFEINPFDEIALEEAIRLRERTAVEEIVIVSIGGAECEEQLRKGLAMGADRAILLETAEELDAPGVAQLLRDLALEMRPDLFLMGKQSTDGDNNQVGQILAALLDWPQATFAAKVEMTGDRLKVSRETDAGVEVVETALPAVVTADLRLNEPRYIALPGIIKARSKPLERRPMSAVPPLRGRILSVANAPVRAPGKRLASVEALVAELKAVGAI